MKTFVVTIHEGRKHWETFQEVVEADTRHDAWMAMLYAYPKSKFTIVSMDEQVLLKPFTHTVYAD